MARARCDAEKDVCPSLARDRFERSVFLRLRVPAAVPSGSCLAPCFSARAGNHLPRKALAVAVAVPGVMAPGPVAAVVAPPGRVVALRRRSALAAAAGGDGDGGDAEATRTLMFLMRRQVEPTRVAPW